MITLPRPLLVLLGGAFSGLQIVVAITALGANTRPGLALIAIVLYAVATVLSLVLGRTAAMPEWLAAANAGLTLTIVLLVTAGLGPAVKAFETRGADLGYSTWYVGAAGTLLTITAVRRRVRYAWFGFGLLAAHTLLWAGPLGIALFGVIGSAVWVASAHVFARVVVQAALDVRQFARAEREAVEWQAAQDAHHFERQVRLAQAARMSLSMLEHIVATGGDLSAADRAECRVLEQCIRDEIRGRRLLNDAVRAAVMAARRRGAHVQVLDDGGVDDVDPVLLDPVLDEVAKAVESVESERFIIRTAPKTSTKAVTVVGLSAGTDGASALGLDDDDETVDLWLELARPETVAAQR